MNVLLAAIFCLLSMAITDRARAEKRVALVIGNSAYIHTSPLNNPKNDATDIASALKKHGFLVVQGFDLDKAGFDKTIRDFATALKGAEAGVFFYAGHGLQVAGQNYLVPTDAKAEGAELLDLGMVRVDVLQRIMERQTSTNVLFLDACRDNPLARNLARTMGTRSTEIGRGLAPVEGGIGTLISFSTQPGNVALDGIGRNSPFAGALVKHLVAPKYDVSTILIDVRNDVMKETQSKQVPWEHSALRGRFYFTPPAPPGVPAQKMPTLTNVNRQVVIVNAGETAVNQFFAVSSSAMSLGEDKLGPHQVVMPGARVTLVFPDESAGCFFDFRAQFAGGRTAERLGFNVCSESIWVIR